MKAAESTQSAAGLGALLVAEARTSEDAKVEAQTNCTGGSGRSWVLLCGRLGAVGALGDEVAQALALLLHAVEQAAGPGEFCGKDTQSQDNHQPARSRSEDHDHAEGEQDEPEGVAGETLGLLHGVPLPLPGLVMGAYFSLACAFLVGGAVSAGGFQPLPSIVLPTIVLWSIVLSSTVWPDLSVSYSAGPSISFFHSVLQVCVLRAASYSSADTFDAITHAWNPPMPK
jgi:hypothetical protein